MKIIPVILLIAVATASTAADKIDLSKLDPRKEHDRNTLLEVVRQTSNGRSNRAAKMLAEAGYLDELLDILRTTSSSNTMNAIGQTRDERTIPIFEARLRAEPGNRYLVNSLGNVQSPRATPILVELLKRHPDGNAPCDQDIVGFILGALILSRCQQSVPILRERLAACRAAHHLEGNQDTHPITERWALRARKSYYAVALLSLGDPTGVPWIREEIRNAIASKQHLSWSAFKLANICEWMGPSFNIVTIEDESIMAGLLPELVRGVSSKVSRLAPDSRRILRILTRHDFHEGSARWQEWYAEHADRHPIYTKSLDRAVKLCMDTFKRNLAEAAKRDERVKWMNYFAGQSELQNGYGAHNDFLWRLESRPEEGSNPLFLGQPEYHPEEHSLHIDELPFRGREAEKALGILVQACLSSRAPTPDHLVFKKEFKGINITVQLGLYTTDEKAKSIIIDCVERTCEILSAYQEFYRTGKDAGPAAAPEGAKPRRK